MITKFLNLVRKLVSRRNLFVLAVIILVLFIGNRGARNNKLITTQQIEKKEIVSEVSSSGIVKSQNQTDIKFQAGGQIAYINVKQGDHVTKYQTIASLNTQLLQKNLQEQLNLYSSQRTTFDDTQNSQKNQVIDDTLKRIAQRSQFSLDNTVINVELQDLAIKFSSVYSPIEGYVVTDPKIYVGSNVLPSETIVTVADLSKLIFVSQVEETEIGKIQQGQEARIALDAFPNQNIDATVESIAPSSVTTSTGSTAFEVRFALTADTKYKIGMNGTANVVLQKAPMVITVPTEAVLDDNTVWIKNGKTFQNKKVEKGIESDTEVEITSGLNEDDTVVTNGFEEIKKGSFFQKILKIS
jgi:HlyD family secretion protein